MPAILAYHPASVSVSASVADGPLPLFLPHRGAEVHCGAGAPAGLSGLAGGLLWCGRPARRMRSCSPPSRTGAGRAGASWSSGLPGAHCGAGVPPAGCRWGSPPSRTGSGRAGASWSSGLPGRLRRPGVARAARSLGLRGGVTALPARAAACFAAGRGAPGGFTARVARRRHCARGPASPDRWR